MSYYTRFNLDDPAAEWDAYEAIESWLGDAANPIFGTMLAAAPELTPEQARFYWSFAGVQGFPVECWIRRYLSN